MHIPYTCGFEYNLISKEGAPEDWDAFDAKFMKFGPVCDWDSSKKKPRINSQNFVDCEFETIDETTSWEFAELYSFTSIGDLLTIPNGNGGNLTGDNIAEEREAISGPEKPTFDDVFVDYQFHEGLFGSFESLFYQFDGFLLKGCE